jgi:ubiquinone/menaquinone biosynthesis C-methylase UbiE
VAITSSTLQARGTNDAVARQWDRAAAGWNRHGALIRRWLRPATDAMLRMAHLQPGMRVLDVAAGAGDQTLDIAERIGAAGSVTAVDVSPAILRLAQDQARRAHHAQVEVRVADGEALPFDDASFDAVVCRLGLMFFPHPEQGVREMARVLRPGGWACSMVFSRPEHNPCITTLMGTALRHAGLPPRDPFQPGGLLSLGRPGHVDTLFRQAGLRDVATTALDAPFDLRSVDEYVDFVRDSAGPVRELLAALDAPTADAAWADITARLRAFDSADGWHGPNELLLTAARR